MKIFKSVLPLIFVVMLSFGLIGGCGGGSGSGGNGGGGGGGNEEIITLLVDATAGGLSATPDDPANKYTYVSLSDGAVVELTDDQAASSENWDLAFKRSTVILNGGASGPGSVSAYFTGNNAEAYDSNGDAIFDWFAASTADSELPDFEEVSTSDIPDSSEFVTDSPLLAITGDGPPDGWWLYDFMTHTVSANPDQWWVVRSDTGEAYAKFHVIELSEDLGNERWVVTLEMEIQNSGDSEFTSTHTETVFIPLGGGSVYFDIETLSQVISTGPWDIRVEYNAAETFFNIYTNGGASGTGDGGAFPIGNEPGLITDGGDATQIPFYFTDSAGGIFIDSIWYAYNLTGTDHQLWPNYRVYLIQTNGEVYKLQILSYYHPQSAQSAWYTIRFQQIQP